MTVSSDQWPRTEERLNRAGFTPLAEPIIDTMCSCVACVERTTETYDLAGSCLNCDATFTVRSRKGDKPPLSIECPSCGVDGYSWRRATVRPGG